MQYTEFKIVRFTYVKGSACLQVSNTYLETCTGVVRVADHIGGSVWCHVSDSARPTHAAYPRNVRKYLMRANVIENSHNFVLSLTFKNSSELERERLDPASSVTPAQNCNLWATADIPNEVNLELLYQLRLPVTGNSY